MKNVFLTFSLLLSINCIYGQDCHISLRESVQSFARETAGSKGIKFTIKLKDTSFTSSNNGDLVIPLKIFLKFKNEEVADFVFYNNLDMEFFREPMFTRTKRTLAEYYNQVLLAARRR